MATKTPPRPALNGGAKLEDLYRGVGIKAVAGAIAKDAPTKGEAAPPKPKERSAAG